MNLKRIAVYFCIMGLFLTCFASCSRKEQDTNAGSGKGDNTANVNPVEQPKEKIVAVISIQNEEGIDEEKVKEFYKSADIEVKKRIREFYPDSGEVTFVPEKDLKSGDIANVMVEVKISQTTCPKDCLRMDCSVRNLLTIDTIYPIKSVVIKR
jgi:hypothetical protein